MNKRKMRDIALISVGFVAIWMAGFIILAIAGEKEIPDHTGFQSC